MDKKIPQKHRNHLLDALSDDAIEIMPARMKGLTARCKNVFLYSRYDPIKKIEEEYRGLTLRSRIVILLGIGLGYLLDFLLKDKNVETIYLVETDHAFLKKVTGFTALPLADSKIIHISDRNSLYRITEKTDDLTSDRVEIIREKTFIHTHQAVSETDINLLLHEKTAERMTRGRFGMVWYDNLLERFSDISLLKTVEMPVETIKKNAHQTLIVGAGPGLRVHLEEIRTHQDFFLIVCIDTVRSLLVKNGINPDMTISIDAQNISAYHFNRKDIDGTGREIFFLDTLSSPAVIKILKKREIAFFRSMNPLNRVFSNNVPAIGSGLSAVNMAVDLLYHLGVRKIILAGIDFSFPSSTPYTGGNYFSRYWAVGIKRTKTMESKYAEYMRVRNYINVPDSSGGTVRTTPVMRSYAEGIENFLKEHPDLEVSTLSKNGINMAGVKIRAGLSPGPVKKTVLETVRSKVEIDPENIKAPSWEECDKSTTSQMIDKYGLFFKMLESATNSLLYKKMRRGRSISEKEKKDAFKTVVYKWENARKKSSKTATP